MRYVCLGFLLGSLLSETVSSAKSAVGENIRPEGIYLARGGLAYVDLARTPEGTLGVRGDTLLMDWRRQATLQAEYSNGRLVLQNSSRSGTRPAYSAWYDLIYYELVPSLRTRGDWDLVRAYVDLVDASQPKDIPDPNSFPPLQSPFASFLHRIDDARVVDYFTSATRTNLNPRSWTVTEPLPGSGPVLELAMALLNEHPSDSTVRIIYLDALVRRRDAAELEKRLAEWKESFDKEENPYQRFALGQVECYLRAVKLSAENRNSYELVHEILADDKDMTWRLEHMPDLLRYKEYADPPAGLIPIITPSMIDQWNTRNFCVEGTFFLLQGRRESALRLLAATYHLGQLAGQGSRLIDLLFGVAIRSVASARLELYALNACESPEDFQEFWRYLEQLESQETETSEAEIESRSGPIRPERATSGVQYVTNALVRVRLGRARFELVRMATAAKLHFVQNGSFPSIALEFTPLLQNGPPQDPFGGAPLRFLADGDPFVCYSVGPDEKDDRAAAEYDPTNGSLSAGDIVTRIPRNRQYPFPRGGVHASTAAELRRVFPNGLPPDPYADTKGRPLGVSNTKPVMVYSYGPDTDESLARPLGENYVPRVLYDPTNGVVSAGDLITVIPPGDAGPGNWLIQSRGISQ